MNLGSALLSSCVQLVWPARCVGCDQVLTTDAAIFCAACAPAVSPVAFACAGCATAGFGQRGRPGRDAVPRARCPVCARLQFAFSRAFAALDYGGPLASGIIRMKHGGRPDLARRLGRLLRDTLARAAGVDGRGGSDDPVDIVLPVPLHPRKLRRRGFNQALDLTRVAMTGMRRPRATGSGARVPALERSLLIRVRDTRELGHFGPGARQVEVFGAFAVTEPWRVVGRRILVVDDVMTTGATLNECAETLMRAGAKEVRVAALARAP
jgi:predicted amidophosphoribosyltransferase